MDRKQKTIIFSLIIFGFLFLMVGTILLVMGALTLNEGFAYASFILMGLGFLLYIIVIIMALIYIKNKNGR